MRARHQAKFCDPWAVMNGSPSISHPPSHASNSPNGRVFVDAPRRGDAYAGMSILLSRDAKNDGPASSITTFAPARVSAYAAMPPPAPEPTMQTSYTKRLLVECQCRSRVTALLVTQLREICIARGDRRERVGQCRRIVALDE